MKCVKAIRPFGKSKVGDIVRVDDSTAFDRVIEGSWIYTSKTDWKNGGKLVKKEETPVEETKTTEVEVQVKKPKFKKGNPKKK